MSKMSFLKYTVRFINATEDAVLCDVKIDETLNIWASRVWIPRSNIRSDDDRRADELKQQVESGSQYIKTHLHVAEWFAVNRKWRRPIGA